MNFVFFCVFFIALSVFEAPGQTAHADRGRDLNDEDLLFSRAVVGKVVYLRGENVPLDEVSLKAWEVVQSGTVGMRSLLVDAETVVVHGAVRFPATNIRIQCEDLVFVDEDSGRGGRSILSTEPLARTGKPEAVTGPDGPFFPVKTANSGTTGLSAGSLTLYADRIKGNSDLKSRIILRGGRGQDAGEGRAGWNAPRGWERGGDAVAAGVPGKGGDGGQFMASRNLEKSGVLSEVGLQEFVDVRGGDPGQKGMDQRGGARAPYEPLALLRRREPGGDALAPAGQAGVDGSRGFLPSMKEPRYSVPRVSVRDLLPISPEMRPPIVELLTRVKKEHPETCRLLAKHYLVRFFVQDPDSESDKFGEELRHFAAATR